MSQDYADSALILDSRLGLASLINLALKGDLSESASCHSPKLRLIDMNSPPPGMRRSSSSLIALSSLSLASPPITPSVSIEVSLNGTGYVGEIPIIFDFLTTGSKSSEERINQMDGLKVNLPPLAKFSPISAFFPMSDSTGSLNTFGRRSGILSPTDVAFDFSSSTLAGDSRRNSASQAPSISVSSVATDHLPVSTSAPNINVIDFDSGQQRIEDISTFTISAYLSPSSEEEDEEESEAEAPAPDESKASGAGGTEATSLTLTAPRFGFGDDKTPTQSTFLRNQLKRRSSPDLCDEKTPTRSTFRKSHMDKFTTTGWSRNSLPSLVSDNVSLSTMEFESASSPSREIIDDDKTPTQSLFSKAQAQTRLQIPEIEVSQTKPLESCTAMNSSSPAVSTDAEHGAIDQSPDLKHAKWLRDTIVELWIDQEGFRAIRPRFFLASVTNADVDPASDSAFPPTHTDPLFTTVAEFLPVSRKPHYFHHAALDRAPTLNRITVDKDESRDYISRVATLALRDNGVFFVHGTEDHKLDGDNGPIVRLNWRFEYFVSSRKRDGRSAHRGEKVFVPLSFTCTPALLDRSRATKVKVFSVMRKSLLPKILAQKLEPPELPSTSTAHSSDTDSARFSVISLDSLSDPEAVPQAEVRASPSKVSLPSLKSGRNILAKATARMRRGSISELPPPLPALRASGSEKQPEKQTARERRGSVGEGEANQANTAQSRPQSPDGRRTSFKLSHKRPKSLDLSKVLGSGARGKSSASMVGPIIPHDELLKLLDQDPYPEILARRLSARVQVVNNEQITVLPPPPPRQR